MDAVQFLNYTTKLAVQDYDIILIFSYYICKFDGSGIEIFFMFDNTTEFHSITVSDFFNLINIMFCMVIDKKADGNVVIPRGSHALLNTEGSLVLLHNRRAPEKFAHDSLLEGRKYLLSFNFFSYPRLSVVNIKRKSTE